MRNLNPTEQTVLQRPPNVYQWKTSHVVSWLDENDLKDYALVFELQRIDGEQLMTATEELAMFEYKIEDDYDRKNFMQQLEVLKENHSRKRKTNLEEEFKMMPGKEQSQIIQAPIRFPGYYEDSDVSDDTFEEFTDLNGWGGWADTQIEEQLQLLQIQVETGRIPLDEVFREKEKKIYSALNYNFPDTLNQYGMSLSKPNVLTFSNLAHSYLLGSTLQNPYQESSKVHPTGKSAFLADTIDNSRSNSVVVENKNGFSMSMATGATIMRISEVVSSQEKSSIFGKALAERLEKIVGGSSMIVSVHSRLDVPKKKRKRYEVASGTAYLSETGKVQRDDNNSICQLSYQIIKEKNTVKKDWVMQVIQDTKAVAVRIKTSQRVEEEKEYLVGKVVIKLKRIRNLPQSRGFLVDVVVVDRKRKEIIFADLQIQREKEVLIGYASHCSVKLKQDDQVEQVHCSIIFDTNSITLKMVDRSINGLWHVMKKGVTIYLKVDEEYLLNFTHFIRVEAIVTHLNTNELREQLSQLCSRCKESLANTRFAQSDLEKDKQKSSFDRKEGWLNGSWLAVI